MDRYIHEQNLAHYRKVLSETTDPTKQQTVLKLLVDEQTNVRQSHQSMPKRRLERFRLRRILGA